MVISIDVKWILGTLISKRASRTEILCDRRVRELDAWDRTRVVGEYLPIARINLRLA